MSTNKQILDMMQNPALAQSGYNDVVTQVDFKLSDHHNPRKARKKNIKMAIKALKPSRTKFFGIRYKHHKADECVVDGISCMNCDYGDLFDQYFRDPVTLEVTPFSPWSGVIPGKGRKLEGTYCPQHLMLYHKLMEWLEQEEEEDPGFFSRMAKKGVAFVPIVRQPKIEEHPLIVKWTPVFREAMKDGIQIVHYTNPVTNENDITMLVFDNRVLQNTAPRGNSMKTMDMAQYYDVIQQMENKDR